MTLLPGENSRQQDIPALQKGTGGSCRTSRYLYIGSMHCCSNDTNLSLSKCADREKGFLPSLITGDSTTGFQSQFGLPSTRQTLTDWSKSSRRHQDGQGLEHRTYKERPSELGLFRWKKERVKGYFTAAYRHFAGGCREERSELLSDVHRDRVRGNADELEHGKLPVDVGIFFFLCEYSQTLEQDTERLKILHLLRNSNLNWTWP